MSHIRRAGNARLRQQGGIWAGTNDGALRFDPVTEKFTAFKSVNPRGANGAIGRPTHRRRQGRQRLLSQMAFDTIVKANLATGETTELEAPTPEDEMARATAADNTFYATMGRGRSARRSRGRRDAPHGHRPRARASSGSQFWSGTLGRVDAKTCRRTLIPLPNTFTQSALRGDSRQESERVDAAVDDRPDRQVRFQGRLVDDVRPANPGTEVRIPALLERGDNVEVVFASARSSKIAVLSVRSEADMAAARAQAQ